jgi:hypothetical protein
VVQRSVVLSGLAEISDPAGCKVYPNPANDVLNIALSLSGNSNIQFSMVDVLGQKVFEEKRDIPGGLSTSVEDISFLGSGIYFLNVNDGVSSLTRKFVVMR